ncbi:hypothetical protein BO71DRAFT_396446 [Aspergillus ellipticus CBS 707.79]|uniref:Uncharacterized protein n=1 Tax=Aspergillus ellipticus CBS 707.79 TaxID=1448320 RepID=A0A319E0D1_9EURO|nr:hypothetical protein BO71DRAFT_396446 [Aspergillus ellipticus CBS 707.79]
MDSEPIIIINIQSILCGSEGILVLSVLGHADKLPSRNRRGLRSSDTVSQPASILNILFRTCRRF